MASDPFFKHKIFITGVAGFIGSHLADRLLAKDAIVVGIDDFNDYYDPLVKRDNLASAMTNPRFQLIEGDIRDQELLGESIAGCDQVVHLAAMAGVRLSMERPVDYQSVNVGGTIKLLEACRLVGQTNVVFASSSSIYGNNPKVPFAEDDRVDHPISIYAASKKAAELACHCYHHLYGTDVTCLRFFTVYGPRQRPDLAIHKFARLILEGKPLPVFGDGSMERDYTFIDDIIDGVLAAMATNRGAGYRIINLGSDRPIRLDSLIQAIANVLGKDAKINPLPTPPCEVNCTWADLTRAEELLGYRPKTKLTQGLERFETWFRERLDGSGAD